MANRLKFTSKKKKQILDEISKDANISRACRYHGVSTRAFYNQKEKDTDFAKEIEKAVQEGVNNHIDECRRRAFRGCSEPVYHQGKVVGFKKVYSDTLAMFLIKKERPEYREKYIDIPTGAKFNLTMDFGNPEDENDI